MDPIVHAHLVLRNKLIVNLPESKNIQVPEITNLIRFGKKLDKLGLLPAPFPIKDLLSPEMIREIYDLYRIKGLSYGNLSVRGSYPGIKGTTFRIAHYVQEGVLRENRCVVIASHDERIAEWADRVFYLQDGILHSKKII